MKCLILSMAVAVLAVVTAVPGNVLAQQATVFKLGFKALADQIPSVAGQPLENEQWGANGDSLQRTTTGLMVWRKADNWTAFTDGSRTWVNGPFAAMERSNEERFEWEAGGEPAARPPTSLAPAAGGFWTVIVRSAGTRAEAEQVAEQLRSSGLPGAVLFSSDYASLNPGYWVAYSGQLADRDSASRESVRLQQLGFAGAYPREVRRAPTAEPESPAPTRAPIPQPSPSPEPQAKVPTTVEELPAYLEGFLPTEAKGKVDLVGGFRVEGSAVSAFFPLSSGSPVMAQKYARDFIFAAYASGIPIVSAQIVMLQPDGRVGLAATLGSNVAAGLPESTWTDTTISPRTFIDWMRDRASVAGNLSGRDRAIIDGPWAE